jgi:hypothetical protein
LHLSFQVVRVANKSVRRTSSDSVAYFSVRGRW